MSSIKQMLVYGYVREQTKLHKINIIEDIISIMIMFYPLNYKIYGIGRNHYGLFGSKQKSNEILQKTRKL